ncbi:DEAD/DEAH box helicase family protein [Pseudomonas sp. PDM26]|uniref:DEAD/DEAH box helicase n=1 Tax=Pseudomonas sp. PDM26 TaxID=2854766 RepID=UPI001C43DB3B|nr:DEAD/DEAH box helicase family protein [Pseudomonas sp. PDM26]MBV7546802.1 DEAD/DEAH box helicase family protein [Pseudomonas sp. PDM26]
MAINTELYAENPIYKSWIDNPVKIIEPSPINNHAGFRKPQRAAIFTSLAHLISAPLKPATVVMPTGTGKTDTILAITLAGFFEKTLVIVPSDALRGQTIDKFRELKNLREMGAISERLLSPEVFRLSGTLKPEDENSFEKSNVVISTPNALDLCSELELSELAKHFSHLIVDEAHHVAAKTWSRVKRSFTGKPCLQFTATPFREDKAALDGDIIYNYPLREAQIDGYFQKIEFHPVREYQASLADQAIADQAVELLRKDLSEGKDHILMARAKTIKKAKEIFKIYSPHEDLSPILVHSKSGPSQPTIDAIKEKKHRIVVCVNMLGEGFDLPELKIAALHDQHCSPAITLQFIGRLTRVNPKLGSAKFVANIANQKVGGQMSALYAESADWGVVIKEVSEKKITRELQREAFNARFEEVEDGDQILALNPNPNISAIAYSVLPTNWLPFGAREMKSQNEAIKLYSVSENSDLVMAVTRAEHPVSWADTAEISTIDWNLYLAYYKKDTQTLFINCSGDEGQALKFKNLITREAVRVVGDKTFRVLHNMNLLKFQNIGLTRGTRDLRFTMHVGRDVTAVLGELEDGTAIKSNIFGIGFENGEKSTAGCSAKGKIWSMHTDSIDEWVKWCDMVSTKINNRNINTRDILEYVVRTEQIEGQWPDGLFYADWSESIYIENERRTQLVVNGKQYSLIDLTCGQPIYKNSTELAIPILASDVEIFSIQLLLLSDGYRVTCGNVEISSKGGMSFADYLEGNPLRLLRTDGSVILGNYRNYSPKTLNILLPTRLLSSWDWGVTMINKESMGKSKDLNTVQGFTYSKISDMYDIIVNDDGSGEIADLVAIKEHPDHIQVDLYHCKYCNKGENPGGRVNDTYVVTGQASRSAKWLHNGEALFSQLLYRYSTSLEEGFDRILKGKAAQLDILRNKCRDIELRLGFYIVQPAISQAKITNEMLSVLGTSYSYVKAISGVDINVIVNS